MPVDVSALPTGERVNEDRIVAALRDEYRSDRMALPRLRRRRPHLPTGDNLVTTRLDLIVEVVRVDAVEVTKFGDAEPTVTPGQTTVTFTNGRDYFDVDWTYRGDIPAVGSRWTLQESA